MTEDQNRISASHLRQKLRLCSRKAGAASTKFSSERYVGVLSNVYHLHLPQNNRQKNKKSTTCSEIPPGSTISFSCTCSIYRTNLPIVACVIHKPVDSGTSHRADIGPGSITGAVVY